MEAWVEELQQCAKGITVNSQSVEPGMYFVALTDNAQYMRDAISRGAVGVLMDSDSSLTCPSSIRSHRLPRLKSALPEYLSLLYPDAEKMPIYAITGTCGKSSVSWILQWVLQHCGVASGYIGTLGIHWPDYQESSPLTTPDVVTNYRLCQQAKQAGLQALCMEVSSHALAQHRLGDLKVHTAIFHNLSHEHLDYHGSMQVYALAKRRLLARSEVKTILLNVDDPYTEFMREAIHPHTHTITYGIFAPADLGITGLHFEAGSITGQVHTPWGQAPIRLVGFSEATVYNVLAVIAAACVQGLPLAAVCDAVQEAPMPPGRMVCYVRAQSPLAIVDYAHKPDALALLLRSARRLLTPHGRLWCVFGCGGNRDVAKRPLMGKIAFELSDRIVITADNARDEDPAQIAAQICAGMPYRPEHLVIELDRARAIALAIEQAAPHDVVIVAGKGHEDMQVIRGQHHAFSDSHYLEGLGYAPKSHI
ncbi:MAG: UDP-N-acetylmuramoyl-L-alanyl-D-glutamate--2,6-diaminopimelate ligase [Pseudomonadota bacterium]